MLYVALRAVDSLKIALHAVPAAHLAAAARAARLRRLDRRAARVPRGRRGRRKHARGADRRLRELGRRAGQPSELPPGQQLREPRAALQEARRFGRRGGARAHARLRRGVIDTHAHLGDDAPRCSRARARPGSRGSSTSRRRSPARTTTLARADARRRRLRLPRHPSARGRPSRAISTSCARCSTIRRPSRWGRPGSTTSATTRRTTRSSALFEAQLALARETGKPVVIHTRAADDDTRGAARRARRRRSILHCFSSPPLLDACARARLVRLVRRQRHVQERLRPARRRAPRPARPAARRDRQPVPRAAGRARAAQRARVRRRTPTTSSRSSCGAATCARRSTRTRRAVFGL